MKEYVLMLAIMMLFVMSALGVVAWFVTITDRIANTERIVREIKKELEAKI